MLKAEWIDFGRDPQSPANPEYPDGIDLDVSQGAMACCALALAHPTPRCGAWHVSCDVCGYDIVLTTAGRADDPRSIIVPCRLEKVTKQ